MKKFFDIAKVHTGCEAECHRILNCYIRYMIKKFNLGYYDHSLFITCARYDYYALHIHGLLIKVRESFFFKKNLISYSPSECNEIDLLVKRLVLRKYNIKIIYDKNYKIPKNISLKPFNLDIFSFFKDIFFDFRIRSSNKKFKKKFLKNYNKSTALIIAHKSSKNNKAYADLSKKLAKYFKNKNFNTEIILPFDIGLSFKDKFKNSLYVLRKLISILCRFYFLKLSDFNFIIFTIYRKLYKDKLKKYFLNHNIRLIVCSYINFQYESVFIDAAKELGIKYFKYDYSLGYPIKDKTFYRYLPDTRKYSDVIFSNSIFRSDQYLISTSFLNNKPKILSHICPQTNYSLSKKRKISSNTSEIKIGIVDNVVFDDSILNQGDFNTLVKFLKDNKLPLKYILQSKRGDLEKLFEKFKISKKIYISAQKGDFSHLRNVDLIISIGWQSLALKAASAYKKPIIFYSQNEYPYQEFIFSINKNNSQIINNLCNELWFSENDLKGKFNNLFLDKNKFQKIEYLSKKLLIKLCFYEGNIDDYFQKYFK